MACVVRMKIKSIINFKLSPLLKIMFLCPLTQYILGLSNKKQMVIGHHEAFEGFII